MLIVVDGSGPEVWTADNVKYAQSMKTSFCSQIWRTTADSRYFRGPTMLGREVSDMAGAIVELIAAKKKTAPNEPIYLAGYSRGGCTAIIVASRLSKMSPPIDVERMYLFDAVDLQASDPSSYRTITANVKWVAHVRSARDLRFWARNPRISRFYFINTGVRLEGKGIYLSTAFTGTHGAIGGVPAPDIPEDAVCVQNIVAWMNPHLKPIGATLKAG